MKLERLKRGFDEIIPAEKFEERMANPPARIKLGVDPTGTELHLGHAVIFNKLRQFQEAGHTVVFIIGDFTAQIGDPSGRDKTRPVLSEDEVLKNAETFKNQVFQILDRDQIEVVYNSEWLENLGASGVVNLAQTTTVARMLERDDFSERFDANQSIRLHEFLYPLFQGYDSCADKVRADFEIGGTDQKFNLLMGRQFQKTSDYEKSPQIIGTMPLLVGLDGSKKMSKTYGNHIPLESSPEEMFGKLMSIPDHLVKNYAILLTDLDQEFIDQISGKVDRKSDEQDEKSSVNENPVNKKEKGLNLKEEKKRVAYEVTMIIKGEAQATKAQDYFERTVEEKQVPDTDEMETFSVRERDIWIVDLLDKSGLVESRSEAKRLLNQGGVYLNGDQLQGMDYDIPLEEPAILRVGKHRYKRVIPEKNE